MFLAEIFPFKFDDDDASRANYDSIRERFKALEKPDGIKQTIETKETEETKKTEETKELKAWKEKDHVIPKMVNFPINEFKNEFIN